MTNEVVANYIDTNDTRNLLQAVMDLEKDKVKMIDDECIEFLRCMFNLSVGCLKVGLKDNVFGRIIEEFIIQMRKMGYGSHRIMEIANMSALGYFVEEK